jgi:perosamine synthetase
MGRSSMQGRIPVASVDVGLEEERYVRDALRSSWISSSGPYIQRAERVLAERTGAASVIAVTNGTVALHLALLALGVQRGDEVLVPSLAYVAVANACRYVGAEPVFVDVDPATWCIDPGRIPQSVTPRTRGIIAVHLYGHPADMDALRAAAELHRLWVVEDAAEAFGAHYRGRPVGALGDIGTYSFFGNKIVTSGEGGALTLRDPALEPQIRMLRDHGMDPVRRYHFPITGYNYRITNVTCAILCAQLERADEILAQRRSVFAHYRQRLQSVPGLAFQPVSPWAEPAPWMFNILVDPEVYGRSASELAALLEGDGIETRPLFPPIHREPPFAAQSHQRGEVLPVSERLGETGLTLPTFNQLSVEDIERVAASIQAHRR